MNKKCEMESEYKLTYFNLRYLGEPIRLMFAYSGVRFEDVRIEWNDWQSIKSSFLWGKLPVLKTTHGEIFQSHAILKYLAGEFNLDGGSKWESAKCHEYVDTLKDLLNIEWPKYLLAQSAEERKQIKNDLLNVHFPHFLGKMDQLLKSTDTKWLVGDKLTYADFFYANFFDIFEYYTGAGLPAKYPELNRIKEQVLALPQLQQHFQNQPADPKFF